MIHTEPAALLFACVLLAAGMASATGRAKDEEPSQRQARARQILGSGAPDYDRIWPLGLKGIYHEPTDEERRAFRTLVPGLLDAARANGKLPSELKKTADGIGFRIETWKVEGDTIWALLEDPAQRRGAGAYLFRVGATGTGPELILEAPHAYFDLGTEQVAGKLFFAPPDGTRKPRALFTNTLQRYRGRPGEEKDTPPHPADVAHNPDHLFQLATTLAANALQRCEVVQLHGFGSHLDDEGNPIDATAMLVVSGGKKSGAPAPARKISRSLRVMLGDGVKLYPDEIHVLGATTNVQGRALADIPGAVFVHLEMSHELRNEFLQSADLRERFARVVLGPSRRAQGETHEKDHEKDSAPAGRAGRAR